MTTVQTMFKVLRWAAAGTVVVVFGAASGCQPQGRAEPVPPQMLVAPYDVSSGEVLWAVAPIGNESGVSAVDVDGVADALVARINEVRGLACLPLNRTFAAMRARGLRAIRTPGEARQLAAALGVDALVVGNVTAYDPYDPPKLGLSLALYSRERGQVEGIDPVRLRSSYTDYGQISRSQFADRPAAVVSEHLDGANHEVQMELRRYAQGRHDADSARGWRGHLASMDLYTEFAAYLAVSRLLDQERLRLGRPVRAVTTANPQHTEP